MKKWWNWVIPLLLVLVCPGIVLNLGSSGTTSNRLYENDIQVTDRNQTNLEMTKKQNYIAILQSDGSVIHQELDSYLTSVVLCEMPSNFHVEALKAQAVVARTYTLRRKASGMKHPGADICTDPNCCQGYKDVSVYLQEGGSLESVEKVKQAVDSTKDLVLIYEGNLIEATYFSCSGGTTEDAVAVWGTDIPYLQSTSSPGEEKASHYTDTVTFTSAEFSACLGRNLSGSPTDWQESVTYTAGGGVDIMYICGVAYSGTTLRSLLGLRSTAFVMTALGDHITITTKGFGHRVGMSQYGADAMAVQGSTYRDILAHYYLNTELVSLDNLR